MRYLMIVTMLSLAACGRASVVDYRQGEQGVAGVKGDKGDQGEQGIQGIKGDDGTPGQVVTPIQLCRDNPASQYPNRFSEVAFCINNKLWAVYSDHGGFMTEIPPGRYSSNGINSSCSFTVKPDCIIQED